jgi:chemotaxis response regulator CheB
MGEKNSFEENKSLTSSAPSNAAVDIVALAASAGGLRTLSEVSQVRPPPNRHLLVNPDSTLCQSEADKTKESEWPPY